MTARAEKAMQEAIANRETWHGETTRGTPTTDAEREAYWTHIADVNEREAYRTHEADIAEARRGYLAHVRISIPANGSSFSPAEIAHNELAEAELRAWLDARLAEINDETCTECGSPVESVGNTLCDSCNEEYEERADREMRADLHRGGN